MEVSGGKSGYHNVDILGWMACTERIRLRLGRIRLMTGGIGARWKSTCCYDGQVPKDSGHGMGGHRTSVMPRARN